MLTGVILIILGILLVIYPQLLAIIVATCLLFSGVICISVARYNRRLERSFENPTIEFFFR
jgi:uncharacterized membrane protein HdeD (DUF308 family)